MQQKVPRGRKQVLIIVSYLDRQEETRKVTIASRISCSSCSCEKQRQKFFSTILIFSKISQSEQNRNLKDGQK
jgi:hypothetical protein